MLRRLALVVLSSSLTFALAGQPEPGAADARDRPLEKMRTLLQQQPTHAAIFDRYFTLLVNGNSVEAEIAALEGKLSQDPADTAASIVLGKVFLRIGKEEQALEVLDAIPAKTPEVQGVLGDIYLKLARFDLAVRALEAAMPAARTSEAKAGVFEKIGKAQLAVGRKDAALAAWHSIGALDGGKVFRRLRVAELLADAGLLDDAGKEYEPLLAETESDPPQHCSVLRAMGGLYELRGDLEGALSTYQRVLALTDRGNWLRKEIEGRLVHIYRRTGRLDELVARLQEQLTTGVDDLAAVEMLAAVFTEMRALDRATALLAKASPRFPKDVRLARRLAELYLEQNRVDDAIAEYQRILSVKPDELELYLEVGQLFARSERLTEAKNQWEKALARNLTDATLCARIAAMYATWNRYEDAVRLYGRAIEIEPDAMPRYTDLADYHFAQSQKDAAVAVLDSALLRAKGNPRRLEALAGTLREHELNDRAQTCVRDWLALEPDNAEARYGLADLLLAAGAVEDARALYWGVVDQDDRGSGHRSMAANTLVDLAVRQKSLDALIAEAGSRDSAGAFFVQGRAHTRQRDFEQAIAAYRKALEKQPSDGQSRVMLARLLAEEGEFQAALGEYERMAMLSASERRRHFREIAKLHLELFDLDAAIEVWKTAMRDNPDNAAVFVEVGKEFMDIQRVQGALEAFQQAVRLRAHDPDVQLRLAAALRQAGKPEEAEVQILSVAKTALDGRDREQARSRWFDLLGEQGTLEKRFDELRARTEENPYDVDAPQLLGDLYMRTGDFVLGLEMVEKSLAFQPRNKELLVRRVELLEALDEWEKALEAHRELVKFPDAERDVHLAGMGQALFELGRAQEAKEVFKQIKDRGRVAKLYAKYELHDEAIEYYQRAIARAPGDIRNYVALAQDLIKRNRREEALAALERGLNVKPYHREALEEIGKLYVQGGRRDDAVRVGMRLFGLRGEQTEKDRREEYEEEQQQQRNWYWNSRQASFGQQRLSSAQSYFEERGLAQEWGAILVAEAKRRPADEILLNAVRSHYGWRDKSASKLAAFLREILAVDPARLRVPPGKTARGYLQGVEGMLAGVCQDDVVVAERRVAELTGDDLQSLRERAILLRCLGKLDEMEATLRRALAQDPLDACSLAMLAEILLEAKRYDECVAPLRGLLAFWASERGAEARAELELRAEAQFRTQRKQLLDDLPRRIRRRITDAEMLAVKARVRTASWSRVTNFSFPESAPEPLAVLGRLIRVQSARKDVAGRDAAIAEAQTMATTIGERSALGTILFQEGADAAATEVLASVLTEAATIQQDPVLVYFWPQVRGVAAAAARSYGELLARNGEVLAAYRVLRDNGHGEKAELIVREHGALDAVLEALGKELADARDKLAAGRTGGQTEIRALELDYRDAVIKLADFHLGEKDFQKAEAIYEGALPYLPDDLDVRKVLALLRHRRGDAAAAVATYNEIIDVKRRRRRANAGDTGTPPTRLVPTIPGESSQSQVQTGGYYGSWSPYQAQRQFNVAEDYLAIMSIYRGRNDQEAVLDLLRRMTREDPTTFRNMSWQVLDIVRNQDLGKRKLPILRLLRGVVANDEWLQLEYARACSEEGELKEAKRTLEKLIAGGTGSSSWYVEESARELEKVDQKLGEHRRTVDDLVALVDADPENVRQRLKLAERLRKEHRYADCLVQALAIVERAPYMMRAKELVVETAAATGKDDVALAMMRRVFAECTETWKKLDRGVSLATWLFGDGKREEAFALIEGLETESGGTGGFSPGNWFLDRHEQERALPLLEAELEKQKGNQWQRQQIRPRVIRIELSTGREANAIKRLLEDIETAGSLADREQRWKDLLRAAKGFQYPEVMRSKLEPAFGKRASASDCLVMAAIEFACGRADRGEAELRSALAKSDKEVYLFPLLIGLRRMHADFEGALAEIERMGKVYGGSDAYQRSGGVSLTQRDSLTLERASILWDMGRDAEADRLVESLVDDTKLQTLQTVAQIYANRKAWEKSLDWRRRYLAKKGTRDRADFLAEAQILIELNRWDEALALARQAHLMSRGDDSARNVLTRIYREQKALPAWVAELEVEYAKDIRDSGLRYAILGIYGELDRDDDRRRIFTALLEHQDLAESALGGLISLCEESDDFAGRLGYMERLLLLKGGEEKKQLHREIAEVQASMEQWAEARASMEKALDLETADGWMEMGEWLDGHERETEAVAAFGKAYELDDKKDEVLAKEASAAHKAKAYALAMDKALAYLRKRRGQANTDSYQTLFLNAVHALPEGERATVLAGTPGDAPSLERAAVLNVALADWPAAERAARATVAADPDTFLGHEALCTALERQAKWSGLAEACEGMRRRVEREFMASNEWSYNSTAEAMQDTIARCRHLLGDDKAAATTWRDQALRRKPYSQNTGSWRSDWSVRYVAEKWLGVDRPALALEALGSEFLLREDPPWGTYLQALDTSGRTAEAEAIAWQRALDPLELYGITSSVGGDRSYWGDRDMTSADGMMKFLIDIHQRRGELDALRTRATELQAAPATKIQGEKLEALVADRMHDYPYLARAAEKKLAEQAERGEKPQASTHGNAARRWLRAGDVGKALDHLRAVLDFDSPGLKNTKLDISSSEWEYERVYSGGLSASPGGSANPFAFGFGGGNSGGYSSYSSWRRSAGAVGYRVLAAALLRRQGNAAKAQEIEDAILAEAKTRKRREVAGQIAQGYADAEVFDHAVRMWRWCLASPDEPALKPAAAIQMHAHIAESLRRGEADAAEVAAAHEAWQTALEERVASAPGPYALVEKAALVRFHLEVRDDPAAVAADLEWLLRYEPDNPSYRLLQARALRLRGDAAGAVAVHRARLEQRRQRGAGRITTAAERGEYGLALLAAGQKDDARVELIAAMAAALEGSRLEQEVKAALAGR